jgi:hypothetical protein
MIAVVVAAVVCLAVAGLSSVRPDVVREWMRRKWTTTRFSATRESAYQIAPVVFAVGFGILGLAAAASAIWEISTRWLSAGH